LSAIAGKKFLQIFKIILIEYIELEKGYEYTGREETKYEEECLGMINNKNLRITITNL